MLCVTNNWLLNANGVGTGPFKPPDYWIRIGLFLAKNPTTNLVLKNLLNKAVWGSFAQPGFVQRHQVKFNID